MKLPRWKSLILLPSEGRINKLIACPIADITQPQINAATALC
jgi:hypothetical protein